MGVLDTYAAELRTDLATLSASGIYPCPENVDIEDVTDSDKTFFAVEVGEYDELDNEHGGGVYVPHIGEIRVRLVWQQDDDPEAFHDTKGSNLQSVNAVVAKVSNWTSGIVLVTRAGDASRKVETTYYTDLIYRVRYRVAEDLT